MVFNLGIDQKAQELRGPGIEGNRHRPANTKDLELLSYTPGFGAERAERAVRGLLPEACVLV